MADGAITIFLSPDIERRLREAAAVSGVSMEEEAANALALGLEQSCLLGLTEEGLADLRAGRFAADEEVRAIFTRNGALLQ